MGKYHLRITGDIGCEVWQDIPGYEGIYQASTYGRIKSLERTVVFNDGRKRTFPSRILRPGYRKKEKSLIVCFVRRPLLETKNLHRLIAITFLPNPYNYPEINHIDENRLNNRIENLEWCSHLYNCNFGTRNVRIWETRRLNQKP